MKIFSTYVLVWCYKELGASKYCIVPWNSQVEVRPVSTNSDSNMYSIQRIFNANKSNHGDHQPECQAWCIAFAAFVQKNFTTLIQTPDCKQFSLRFVLPHPIRFKFLSVNQNDFFRFIFVLSLIKWCISDKEKKFVVFHS